MSLREEKQKRYEQRYMGKTIRIISMNNPDSPQDDSHYNGKTGIVDYVDSECQLWGTWGGLAVNPAVDDFEIIDPEEIDENENFTV
jgi:hypothetical protein